MPDATPATDPPDAERDALAARLVQAEKAANLKHFNEAVGVCQDILEAHPATPGAFAILGAVAAHRGRVKDAIRFFERAVELNPAHAAWHGNLCGLYRAQLQFDQAVAAGRRAVQLAPAQARHHVALARSLLDLDQRDAALESFMAALVRDPESAEAHLGLGQILLAEGDFRPGWIEYIWRNQLDQAKGLIPRMVTPEWNGMRLPNDRILLVGDQGFGDTIQFARFIPLVAERCREVVVGCSPELAPLLATMPGLASVHTRWDEIPAHGAHSLLSSLPGIFGIEERTIPRAVPYFTPDPALRAPWAERLAPARAAGRRIVGLVWAGRPTHPNDSRRSVPLDRLGPIAEIPDLHLVSLQKPLPARDAATFAALGLTDWSDALPDFSHTAALLAEIDLVITIDSAVAHLAGACGRPVWVLSPTPSDWRWLQGRDDSPWYPTLRLFRQPTAGDWEPVLAALISALGKLQ